MRQCSTLRLGVDVTLRGQSQPVGRMQRRLLGDDIESCDSGHGDHPNAERSRFRCDAEPEQPRVFRTLD